MSEARKIPPFGLRMPEQLHCLVKKAAEKNRRSMNAEILVMLESVVGKDTETEKATEAAA